MPVAASSPSRSANRSVRALPLTLIIAVGVALRLYLIADKSLWLDESFSIWMGRQPIGATLDKQAERAFNGLNIFIYEQR